MRNLWLLAILILTSGCTEMALKELVGGTETCPANEYNLVFQNKKDYKYVDVGLYKKTVMYFKFRNAPEFKEVYKMVDGSTIEGYFFQVSESALCTKNKDEQMRFVPVFFNEKGVVVGKGDAFFKESVHPYLKVSNRTALLERTEIEKSMLDHVTSVFGY